MKKTTPLTLTNRLTKYSVLSLAIASVADANGQIENNSYVIEAKTISSGIYIIELEDATTKEILRKKIIL